MDGQRILLLEDSAADAELVVEMLADVGTAIEVVPAPTLATALALLADGEVDVALTDLSLPDADGMEAVRALREAAPDLPLVILTGNDDDLTALDALAAGAQDYLPKNDLTARLLLRSVRYARERMRADMAVRRSARWTSALLDGLDAPTCAVDAEGRVVALNAAMRSGSALLPITCFPGDDLLAPTHDAAPVLAQGLRDVLTGDAERWELECRAHDERWWSVRITPLTGGTGAVVMQVDVTALKRAQQELTMAALHDPLTRLPNRTLLHDRLEQAFGYAALGTGAVAVVFLDLDRFKLANDTLGHAAGDAILVAVAERLTQAADAGETVARVSGDEFVVAFLAEDDAHARRTAQALLAAVIGTVRIEGRDVPVSATAGLAVAARGDSADDLLRAADEAMYVGKSRGGGRLEIASAQLRDLLGHRLEVEAMIDAALEEDRLEVHYQPVVRLADGETTGAEALVRLRLPDGRLLAPSEFIEAAERSGQIVPLGTRVLERACADAARWTGEAAGLTVAVNLSTRQLGQPDVVDTVRSALRTSGLPAYRLVLEVTESAVVEDADAALLALQALKALGVRTAIDDFGTGYSSFVYLKQFPVDLLKIDRSFVDGMLDSPDDAAIVASIVRLGIDVGVGLIAEGVETEEQRAHLLGLGCTEAQGYLFARPVPQSGLGPAVVTARRAQPAPVRPAPPGAVPEETLQRMDELHREGASMHTIAAVLNREGLLTPLGRRWHPRSVAASLQRAAG